MFEKYNNNELLVAISVYPWWWFRDFLSLRNSSSAWNTHTHTHTHFNNFLSLDDLKYIWEFWIIVSSPFCEIRRGFRIGIGSWNIISILLSNLCTTTLQNLSTLLTFGRFFKLRLENDGCCRQVVVSSGSTFAMHCVRSLNELH
jgi:hypothetical protein